PFLKQLLTKAGDKVDVTETPSKDLTSYFARLAGVRSFDGVSVTSTLSPALVRSCFRKGVVSFHLCPWSPVMIRTLIGLFSAPELAPAARSNAAIVASSVRMV